MTYPENAGYKNHPKWLDRAIEGEKRAEGGAANGPNWAQRFTGRTKLRDEMAGTPSPTGFDFTRRKDQAEDLMRGQMERAKDISDAVPRKSEE